MSNERGYTLVELLVVMSLLSLVVGALATLWVSGSNTQLRLDRQFRAQQSARLALDRIRIDIHCANAAQAQTIGTYPGVKLAYPASGCSTSTVSWCAVPSADISGRYALYRSTATSNICTSTDASRLLVADDLTTSSVFSTTLVNNALETVNVDFAVSANAADATKNVYELKDSIVVQNSARCASSGACTSPTVP